MLVLTRQRLQSVMIGSDIEMQIVDIRGDKVRLGFNAPRSVQIHRKEVFEQIAGQGQANSGLKPDDFPREVSPVSVSTREVNPAISAMSQPEGSSTMDPFLRAAIDEAKQGLKEGGLPIGSVLVRGNQIIGRGHNRRVQHGDPMAHAEIDCLTKAGRQASYRDTVLYSTLMPCFLCSGAAVQFGVPKVIVGESVTFPGGEGKGGRSPEFMRSHGIEVIDLHDAECIEMMTKFIRENPKLWNEDIGV